MVDHVGFAVAAIVISTMLLIAIMIAEPGNFPKLNMACLYIPVGLAGVFIINMTRSMDRLIKGGDKQYFEPKRTAAGRARLPFVEAKSLVSPNFNVRDIQHPDGFNMTLIDESGLIGGSKQRALIGYVADIGPEELVYAGPSTGYAQVAIAYCALLAGKRARIFVDAAVLPPLSENAKLLGAEIVPFTDRDDGSSRLKKIQKVAESYVDRSNGRAKLLPFGMDHPDVKTLYENAFAALKSYKPERLWIVAGSGMIFSTLARIWPDTEFMIVQVGKKIWPDQVAGIKHQLFISPYGFSERIKETPPYNTLMNYDAKVWPFVISHGRPGDWIWNTAGEPMPRADLTAVIEKTGRLLAAAREAESKLVTKAAEMTMPMFHDAMPPAKVMFESLKQLARTLRPSKIVPRNFTRDYTVTDGISNHFSELVRMDCIVNRSDKISPKGYWKTYRVAIAREAFYLGGANPGPLVWRDAMNATKCYECGTFNPVILINAIKRYFPDREIRMLDPSMGWGDRLIGALAVGVDMYLGFDPNIHLAEAYKSIKNTLAPEATATFIADKFSLARIDKSLVGSFDLAFTSPPFFNEEIYIGTEADVSGTYQSWLTSMYEPYLRDMAATVSPVGIIAVYIDNVPRIANMANDTTRVLNAAGFGSLETLLFRNDHTGINGLEHAGHPRSLWVFKRGAVSGGGSPAAIHEPTYPGVIKYETKLSDEVIRLEAVNKLLEHFNKILAAGNKKSEYEVKNIVERFLLESANRATVQKMGDPVLGFLHGRADPVLTSLMADVKYKFPKLSPADEEKLIAGVMKIVSRFEKYTSQANPEIPKVEIKMDDRLGKFTLGNYQREITAERMRMLISRAGEDAVIKMLIRYACIISGSQHWEAPAEYFKVLYALGVRFEGFASPVNSQFARPEFPEARFCSLFPDTDAPFGSIGGFFQTDFLTYWSPEAPPQVVVGPPYYDELILNIARRIIDHCDRAIASGRAIRFIITHSNSWDYSNGFKLLAESKYKRLDHVYRTREHFYNDDRGSKMIARFETRLFVLDAGMSDLTDEYKSTLLTIFPKTG